MRFEGKEVKTSSWLQQRKYGLNLLGRLSGSKWGHKKVVVGVLSSMGSDMCSHKLVLINFSSAFKVMFEEQEPLEVLY